MKTVHFDSIDFLNRFNQNSTYHPLVSVLDFSKTDPRRAHRMVFGVYVVYLKKVDCGNLIYGKQQYDYQEKTLVFVGPGQSLTATYEGLYQPRGRAVAFHPDLLIGTPLATKIRQYGFFSYHLNEGLHLSEREESIINDCFNKIAYEVEQPVDKHSRTLVAANIDLFLQYCARFYDRQFITREHVNQSMLVKFDALLTDYLASDRTTDYGLPTVAYFAEALHFSPNYFGDLVKNETGLSAQDFIQRKIVEVAKEQLLHQQRSISEIAYGLGYKYPNHFSRTFRRVAGVSPKEFREVG